MLNHFLRFVAFSIVIILSSSSVWGQSWFRRRKGDRSYTIVRPILRPDDGYRLLVFLHGQGGNDKQGLVHWKAEAASKGYVLVCPASKKNQWVSAGEDLQWVGNVILSVRKEYDIPAHRTLITGHSAGGSAALFFGLPNPILARAIVAVNATIPLQILPQLIRPTKPAILFLVGEFDWNRQSTLKMSLALRKKGYKVRMGVIPGAFHSWNAKIINPLVIKWFERILTADRKTSQPE